jgi:hypothetical protein
LFIIYFSHMLSMLKSYSFNQIWCNIFIVEFLPPMPLLNTNYLLASIPPWLKRPVTNGSESRFYGVLWDSSNSSKDGQLEVVWLLSPFELLWLLFTLFWIKGNYYRLFVVGLSSIRWSWVPSASPQLHWSSKSNLLIPSILFCAF